MRPLPRPLQVLVTWASILPLAVGTSLLVGPVTPGWPDALRIAAVITIVVPVAVLWVVPAVAGAARRLRDAASSGRGDAA